MTPIMVLQNRSQPHSRPAPYSNPNRHPAWLCTLAAWAAIAVTTTVPSLAIQPAQWVHTTEADFAEGWTEDTVVTNLGDVKLATRTQVIGEVSQQASIIHDLQLTAKGDVYMAVGPEAALLLERGGQIDQILKLPGEQVFALAQTSRGRLIVAVSAPDESRVTLLEGDKLKTIVRLPGVRYIWDVLVDGRQWYLATGTEGKLLRVDLDQRTEDGQPAVSELLDAAQNNLLCLGRDDQGRIYTGSDGDGLIYRLTVGDQGTAETFVLYDAPEPEIGALLVLGDGTVYAGTADADQARPGRLEEAASAESGRPDVSQPADQDAPPDTMPHVPPSPDPIGPQPESSSNPHGQPTVAGSASSATPAADASPTPQPFPEAQPAGSPSLDSAIEPTPAQWDRLRETIRLQLDTARRDGSLQASKGSLSRSLTRTTRGKRNKSTTSSSTNAGNAIYQINAQGFVTEVFRESVMILKIVHDPAGKLVVATGNEGQVFQVDPVAQETTILTDLDPQQIPAMVGDGNGHVLLGTANPAMLVSLETGYAREGTYTSPVLDATQISLWGGMSLSGVVPQGTSITLTTHSGNVEDPDQAAWSGWSTPQVLGYDPEAAPLAPREARVMSPPARFLQYRLAFTGHDHITPVVGRAQVTYVVPNLKPAISSIQASYPNSEDGSSKSGKRKNRATEPAATLDLKWEASDPNDDQLIYDLEYQPAGSAKWLPLFQDLEDTSCEWDTRLVPDGRYIIRVTASDRPDNPAQMAKIAVRRTDPILIDNSPPLIDKLDQLASRRGVIITATARDALSPIQAAGYNIDSADQWEPLLPDDLIFDSTQEAITINIPDLAQGSHVVTLRVIDQRGNAKYEGVLMEIGHEPR